MKSKSSVCPVVFLVFVGLACGQSEGTNSGGGKGGSSRASVSDAGGNGGKSDTGRGDSGGGGGSSDAGGSGGRAGQTGSGGSVGGSAASGGNSSASATVAGRSGSGGSAGVPNSGGSTSTGGTANSIGNTSSSGSTSTGGNTRTGGTNSGGGVAGQSGSSGTGGTTGSGGTVAGSGGRGDASAPGPDSGGEAGMAQWLPCPTDGSACKILPYGDSITQGFPFAAQGGYRAPLFRLAQADKKKVTFIGRLSDGPDKVDNVTFPKNHEGHFAMSIEWLTDGKNMPDSVIQPAHIVLLHAGTNNRSGQPADAAKKLETLIDKILAAAPNALLFVSTILPCGDNGPEDAFVRAYDPLIPPIVEKRAKDGKHIRLVDQYASFAPATMFTPPEKYHPNLVGYAHMADVWYEAIKSVLP